MKNTKWKIEYYVSSTRKISPVALFIASLTVDGQAKLANTFSLLEDFGIQVGPPHIKKVLGTPLWEIRILGKNSVRIFYIVPNKGIFLLLHGFIKKKQKTPRKEIEIALDRLKEYTSKI